MAGLDPAIVYAWHPGAIAYATAVPRGWVRSLGQNRRAHHVREMALLCPTRNRPSLVGGSRRSVSLPRSRCPRNGAIDPKPCHLFRRRVASLRAITVSHDRFGSRLRQQPQRSSAIMRNQRRRIAPPDLKVAGEQIIDRWSAATSAQLRNYFIVARSSSDAP